MKRIAINGFGRIGRAAFKIALEHSEDIEVVGINDLFDTKTLAYLLKFDTVYRTYSKTVEARDGALIVDGKSYPVFAEREPQKLPWGKLTVDTVIESTGIFRSEEQMRLHIQAGAKRVLLSAPQKGEGVATEILGISDIAAAGAVCKSATSCTTNSIAVPVKILHEHLLIKKAVLTTIHAYTADQNLVDGPHKDLRRGRTAGQNIVPTSTGAAVATTEVIPELKGKFDGTALRVPVCVGSISDITMLVEKQTTKEEVNAILEKSASLPEYKKILSVSREPLVSSDIIGLSYSCIIDAELTQVIDHDLVKIFSWYDNEWGYSNRLIEMIIAS